MSPFISCKKGSEWDAALNGVWVEATNNTKRALPSNCTIEFKDGEMIICDESVVGDLNKDSKLNASDGQIWISYRLGFRKHEEFRYDYQFEGNALWIIEETSADFRTVVNNSLAKKYYKQ